MKNIAIFISGSGSDMQSIIDAIDMGSINGKIQCVVANKDNIFGIERAIKHNIEYKVFKLKDYENEVERDQAIIDYLKPKNIDLIVLAGYLAIVSKNLVDEYRQRIINIHPALIPSYCGVGMYGMNVHKAVILGREKYSGATIHYVDEGADTGKIIAQERVPVYEDDTPETLQKRVLELEHKMLPEVVKNLCK